jgi:CRISPR/Cas system-associated protein Cas10 (large subunit of type III CRISPR-Cas system)|tara:strand:- start:274 stop:483 length:210 start_codon:yes stop_codon:yes gene_type:complete
MQSESQKNNDPCAVCDTDLFINEQYTHRIGLVDGDEEVLGWMCPFCRSEFDIDGHVQILLGSTNIKGKA